MFCMGRRRRCRFKCPFLGPQSVAKAILWFFLFFPLFSCLVVPKAMITANDYRVPSWVEWEKDTKLANVQRFPIDTHIDKCGRNVVGVGLRPYQCLSSGVLADCPVIYTAPCLLLFSSFPIYVHTYM